MWLKKDIENLRLGYYVEVFDTWGTPRFVEHRTNIITPQLPARVISDDIRFFVICMLLKTIPSGTYKVIHTFRKACYALMRPENYILVPSGQYIAVEKPLRTESDMANEIVRKMVKLPKYTAYAKVLGVDGVRTAKIQTFRLPMINSKIEEVRLFANFVQITENTIPYLKLRSEVQEEIGKRQNWKQPQETKALTPSEADSTTPPPMKY